MTKSFLFISLLCLSLSGFSEEVLRGSKAYQDIKGAEVIRYRDHSSIPAYIKFRETDRIDTSDWKQWLLDRYFKGHDKIDFNQVGEEKDRLGMEHLRFKQTVNGIPLSHGNWIVHTLGNKVVSMNGHLIEAFASVQPSVSESNALNTALAYIDGDVYAWEIAAEEEVLQEVLQDPNATHFPKGSLEYFVSDYKKDSQSNHLNWKFDVYSIEPLKKMEVFVDALDGSIVHAYNQIHDADTNITAVTGYLDTQDIVADWTGTQMRLVESGRGNGIITTDLNNGTSGPGVDFTHPDNLWDETSVSRFATDAHFGTEMTYDYFYDNFGRNSIDNNGFILRSRVHYSTNYANAFWNGYFMTYGDGSSGLSPFTGLDICGHEVSHGLTQFTASLVYEDEYGALNESFSDIFGAAIEYFALGEGSGEWLIGEDINLIIRNMANPNAEGDPDTYQGSNWIQTGNPSQNNDWGGVHTNSGVQNHWFYLLSVGGTGTNDIGNEFEVEGIGVLDAGAIAFRNLTVYLSAYDEYADARFYALQSAMDLYGPCSQQLISTANAWYAVGVGTPYEDEVTADFIPSSTGDCDVPHTVSFVNTSSNATSQYWFFGDGGSSSQFEPSRTYSSAGTYTVTLAVSSNCGIDTLVMPDLIQVGPGAPCEVTMPSSGMATYDACAGVLIDDGGATGNYSDDVDGLVVISSQGAADITLTFNEFVVEPGGGTNCIYDFMEIFDGAGVNAPLIGKYCNSNPPPASLTTSGDDVTIRFVSDGAQSFAGFKIAWECNEPTVAPATAFKADVVQTCDGQVNFMDLSENGTDAWEWDFGDGNTSTAQNPTHTYAESGLYTVRLIASNSIGSDTLVQEAYIQVFLSTPPEGADDDICPGESGTLIAEGFGEMRWYAQSFGGDVIHVGDTFVTPIVQQSTAYYVESVVKSSAKSVGPEDKNFGSGGYLANQQGLVFDALSDMVLHSVKVFGNSGGQRQVLLYDDQGFLVADTTKFVPNGEQEIILDFEIPQADDYRLEIGGNNTINLYRNTTGVNFPYVLDGVCEITSSTGANPLSEYYFFYDWQVEEICVSERSTIAASTGICTGVDEIGFENIQVFPNPTRDRVTVQWPGASIDQVEILNIEGRSVRTVMLNEASEQIKIEVRSLPQGLYLFKVMSDGKTQSQRVIVQ